MCRYLPGFAKTFAMTFSLACALVFSAQTACLARGTTKQTPTQLPRAVKPTHYTISIVPDAAQSRFTGQVSIALEVLQPTRNITLNAADLAIQSVQLSAVRDRVALTAQHIDLNADRQTATFSFPAVLAKGSYILTIAYSGLIGSQANGLFHLDYDTVQGHQRALYTQFENSDARRFVPSWDEPDYKASFALQATVPAGQMAVSNMPVAGATGLADGRKLVQFQTTPKMSTYLLFFAMGDFERTASSVDGTEVGVITQRGLSPQAAFALSSSAQILKEYNDYFGVRYGLPKLDNIAAPGSSQFFSAMENWGAIFTFEDAILLDPDNATQSDRENAFITEAHEMAHQWFGNLVTMRWWSDLWLNEGFASWMENRSAALLHPEWHTGLKAVEVHQTAMEEDALSSSHPIIQQIDTVEQASLAFDEITYQKGESVIRMLENYVGADAWRDGVRRYMQQHAYGNTGSDDFWRAIDASTSKPVSAIAQDFTLQSGIPMIKVGTALCHAGHTTVNLTQSEFSRDHVDRAARRWRVPVTARLVGSDAQAQTLVANGSAKIELPGCGPVLLNAGQAGYFRTWYPHKQFTQLAERYADLAPIDQLGLLADTWSLGLAGLQPMADVLDLAAATPPTADPELWISVTGIYNSINHLYRHAPQRQQQFNRYAIAQLAPVLESTGWSERPGDSSVTIKLREQLILTLSQLDDQNTISAAVRRFDQQASDPAGFPPQLRKVISSVVARHADAARWEQLHAMAMQEKSPMRKDQLYHLLATVNNLELTERALQIATSGEPGATISAGMLNQAARNFPDQTFDFALAHLSEVEKLVDGASGMRYMARLAEESDNPTMPAKLNRYAKAHIPALAMGSVRTALANMQYHIRVGSQRLPEIDTWLARRNRIAKTEQ